jgi:hypothetical protein
MAGKSSSGNSHTTVVKRTNQGGGKPKTSSMNKTQKGSHKGYRGQGR